LWSAGYPQRSGQHRELSGLNHSRRQQVSTLTFARRSGGIALWRGPASARGGRWVARPHAGEESGLSEQVEARPDRVEAPRRAGDAALPDWYRTAAAASWRFLAIAGAVAAVVYALVHLRVVVLPIIAALLASTLLLPLVRWLKDLGVPDGLAAAGAMITAILLVAAIATAVAPSVADQFGDLRPRAEEGVREASDVLADPPFNVSKRELDKKVDEGIARLRENSGPLARGLQSGAVLLGEVITGLIIAVLLTFFLLKDGARIWGYVLSLMGDRSRGDADELGRRAYAALAGYVRGIALVGLVDAVLIGLALVIIGVPLVVPLMIITFFAAFIPLIGAFVAGLVAVLIALVAGGPVDALLVLGAIVLVQQVEGHLLYPVLMSRTVHLHPAVIVVALAAGGVLGGIIGVFLAVPLAGIASVVLEYSRDRPPPESPLVEEPATAG
jgi:putative heme transporter